MFDGTLIGISRIPRGVPVKIAWIVLILALLSVRFVVAQDATVVFYTHGNTAGHMIPGTKHNVFTGSVFDGTQGLVQFLDALLVQNQNNRFIVFRLPAGSHTFSAGYLDHASTYRPVAITLESGKTYFFRAQSEALGPGIPRGRLDQVPCDLAGKETAKSKPLHVDNTVATSAAALLAPNQSIPACP